MTTPHDFRLNASMWPAWHQFFSLMPTWCLTPLRHGAAQVAAGQGTIALEILAELPSTASLTVFVPVGGGGLIAGTATLHPCMFDAHLLWAGSSSCAFRYQPVARC